MSVKMELDDQDSPTACTCVGTLIHSIKFFFDAMEFVHVSDTKHQIIKTNYHKCVYCRTVVLVYVSKDSSEKIHIFFEEYPYSAKSSIDRRNEKFHCRSMQRILDWVKMSVFGALNPEQLKAKSYLCTRYKYIYPVSPDDSDEDSDVSYLERHVDTTTKFEIVS